MDENKALQYTINEFKLNVNRNKMKPRTNTINSGSSGSSNNDMNPLQEVELDIEDIKLRVQGIYININI